MYKSLSTFSISLLFPHRDHSRFATSNLQPLLHTTMTPLFSALGAVLVSGLALIPSSQAVPSTIQPLTYSPACANANSNSGVINGNTYYNCYYPETFNSNCASIRDEFANGACDLGGYVQGQARCRVLGDGNDSCAVCSNIEDMYAACGAMYTVLSTIEDQCQGHLGSICNGAGDSSLSECLWYRMEKISPLGSIVPHLFCSISIFCFHLFVLIFS